ncbi:MAG: hypothetical protein Q9211_001464 [Gyalolechia sp. 1 TL-2023]
MAQVQVKTALKRKLKHAAPNAPTMEIAQQSSVSQTLEYAQQQSFKVIHTLLHSSLAYLAYLRHLFPEECFKDRSFESIYTDAEARSHLDLGPEEPRKKQKKNEKTYSPSDTQLDLKVFVHDSHPGVKTFLSWLIIQDGILEGVLKSTITAAQFCVCPDQTDRTNVIESYTFRFYYRVSNNQSGRELASLALTGTTPSSISVTNAREGLRELIRLIVSHTSKMPDLPDTRFLTCHLFHLPDPSFDFKPYGFGPSVDRAMSMPCNRDWRPKTIEAGAVDSGHHRVSLNITHMQLIGEEEPHSDELYGIPDRMLHNRKLSRVTGSPQGESPEYDNGGSPNQSTSSCASHGEAPEDNSIQIIQSPTPSLVATPRLPSPGNGWPMSEMQLSQALFAQLEQRRISRGCVEGGNDARDAIHCQCNLSEKEGAMVQCSFCHTWQHCHCYGYDVESFPERHACYSCLFGDVDTKRLAELKEFALTRRCLWLIYSQDSPKSQAELTRALGMFK